MLQSLSCQDASERVPDEVDALVIIQSIDQVQPYLLGHHFSKFLNRFIYLILDALDQQTMAVGTVDVHEVSCLLKVNAAALVTVDKHHK